MLNMKTNMEQHIVLLGDLKKQRTKEYNQAWYETNGKQYYYANRERINFYYRQYRERNKQKNNAYMKEYMREYYHKNKEKWNNKKK